MKLRMGFVSNSSSSSFVFIGKKIGILDEAPRIDFTKPKVTYIMLGTSLSEGDDIIDLNDDLYNWFVEHKDDIINNVDYFNGDIYEVYSSGDDYAKINKVDVKSDIIEAVHIYADYNSTDSINKAEEIYLHG